MLDNPRLQIMHLINAYIILRWQWLAKDLCTFRIWSRLQSAGMICSTSLSKLMLHINPTVLSAAADAFDLTYVAEHYTLLSRTK